MNETDELLPTRRTLLSRLKDWNDQENWRLFFDTYWRLIYNTALQGGLTDAEAQDAVQETVISVMKSLPTFRYEAQGGSFKSWLLQLTRWRILDQLKKRDARLAGQPGSTGTSPRTATLERQPDPARSGLEAAWDREWEANLLAAAVERVKQKVAPKQYQIFDLHAFKQWPVTKVARTLGISVARVYWTQRRLTRLLQQAAADLRDKPI